MTGPNEPGALQREKDLSAVIEALIMLSPNPALFREICYWSREPGLLPLLRAVAGLSEATRDALEAFVRNAPESSAIVAQLETGESLRLAYSTGKAGGE
jgi:hypothetical protein